MLRFVLLICTVALSVVAAAFSKFAAALSEGGGRRVVYHIGGVVVGGGDGFVRGGGGGSCVAHGAVLFCSVLHTRAHSLPFQIPLQARIMHARVSWHSSC